MTPADEARFITLWTAGTETAAMAQALGIPRGTVSSRAYTLVRQGKIQPRPKGGNYPRSKAQVRGEGEEGVSMRTPRVSQRTPEVSNGVSNRVSSKVSKRVSPRVPVEVLPAAPPPTSASDMNPLLQDILQELRTLTQGLAGRVSP
jgi:hypothetical protein